MDPVLQRLSDQAGLQTTYEDAFGIHREVPEATVRGFLQSMDRMTERAGADVLPPVIVVDAEAHDLSLGAEVTGQWRIDREDGLAWEGRAASSTTIPLPEALPLGYHALTVTASTGAVAHATLIAAPRLCYRPEVLRNERRWGLAIQLYAIRSDRNWGIGDFTDLRAIVTKAAQLGAAVVGLNPLHALFHRDPEAASPYSPNSRLFLNTLYIDVEAAPDFVAEVHDALRPRLDVLRRAALLDYTAVADCKHAAFAALFQRFSETDLPNESHPRTQAFHAFQTERGDTLHAFTAFEARSNPDTSETFHAYLQWEADRQLAHVQAAAKDLGMTLGLYRDLAVGASGDGAEAQANRAWLVSGAHVGAPPDAWNVFGQDWGLPPFEPHRLRRAGYKPLRDLIAANMRHAGALRIDHILGFLRLFWIPAGASPHDGAYIGYPWEEMRAVLAVESHRHRCLIIGEDLGTVPPGFDQKLRAAGILSTRLFYFEKEHDGAFKPPEAYPEDALIAIGTHDLPTFAAYWSGADHALRTRLGLWTSDAQREMEAAARVRDRDAMRAFIGQDATDGAPPMLPVTTALADAPSRLLMVQIEDLAGQVDQVNVPGTWREYPNWRARVPVDAAALLDGPVAEALGSALAPRTDRAG